MLTQTSELAIKSLIYLALHPGDEPVSPKQMAEQLDCSPSYLAKVTGMLVKAGLLQSVRGVHGGVLLTRASGDISLLDIVEACQGLLIGNYCAQIASHGEKVCSFHRAMNELHEANQEVLSRWTLADLLETPVGPKTEVSGPKKCKMFIKGSEKLVELQAEGEQ